MHRYEFEVRLPSGQTEKRESIAASVGQVAAGLEAEGVQLLSIRQLGPAAPLQASGRSARAAVQELLGHRSHWLAPLQAFLAEFPSSPARRETNSLVRLLDEDLSVERITESVEGAMLLPLLNAGRSSNRHSEGAQAVGRVSRWVEQLDQQRTARWARWRAVMYPLLLLVLVAALLCGMVVFIVPTFREMFSEFGLSLPVPTRSLIWVSDQLTQHAAQTALAAACSLALCIAAIHVWRKFALTNRIFGRLVAGTSGNLVALSRISSTLAELLDLEVTLEEALRIAGNTCGHAYFASACRLAAQQAAAGKDLQLTSHMRRLSPLVMGALCMPMEQSGQRVALLREYSLAYADRARRRVDWLTTGIHSVAVLLVGLVIAYCIIALFMPLVTMISSLA